VTLQNICERRNIQYRFFMHSVVDHEHLTADQELKSLYDEIDWSALVGTSIEETKMKYTTTQQFNEIEETGKTTFVPNPLVQFDILHNTVAPVLRTMGATQRNDIERLKRYCEQKQNTLTKAYNNKNVQ